MRRGVSARAYGGADKETGGDVVGEGTGVFSKKAGRKKRKEGAFRKKVHKILFVLSPLSKIETFFSQNLRSFETKFLLLRLIKHNFPFIPPHCGVHIAQSRGTFPDHPAQTLFDLLNLRDFALSLPIGTSPKGAVPQHGVAFAQQRPSPWVCTERRGARGRLLFHQKRGRSPSRSNVIFATPIRFLSYHPCSESSCVWSVVRGARGSIGASLHRSWSDLKQKLPTNRRKTRFVGSSIIS